MAHGETLRKVCASEGMPAASTVVGWAQADVDGFAEQYARAREQLCAHWAEEIVEIADDGSNDTIKDQHGNERADSEWITRSRLRVDTRKWLLSKLLPKQYGDKVELSGSKDAPVTVEIVRFTKPE